MHFARQKAVKSGRIADHHAILIGQHNDEKCRSGAYSSIICTAWKCCNSVATDAEGQSKRICRIVVDPLHVHSYSFFILFLYSLPPPQIFSCSRRAVCAAANPNTNKVTALIALDAIG